MTTKLLIAAVQRPAAGQMVCGDVYQVLRQGVRTVVVVADGLGHGQEAAAAAADFCRVAGVAAHQGIEHAMHSAHQQLRGSRGAAAAILRFDEERYELQFTGVGNIEMQTISRAAISPVSVPGIVGQRILKIKAFTYPLAPGDLLVVYSDGVSQRFNLASHQHLDVDGIAHAIMAKHGKAHDDATCVVIRIDRH